MFLSINNYKDCIEEFYNEISSISQDGDKSKLIAFYGQPDQRVMDIFRLSGYRFLDLDIDYNVPDFEIVPEVCCHIIKDIVNNVFYFKEQILVTFCTTGIDKCDQARNVRDILLMEGFDVIDATNFCMEPIRPLIISTARSPLKERVSRIMELCFNPLTEREKNFFIKNQCEPVFSFHGVPPEDINLLDVFPEETHIQGWTRLVELGTPGKIEMEWKIENSAPTVFYTQSFCNKGLMGKYLAERHNGLHIDGHGKISSSVMAKLEAFIKMRRRRNDIM